MLCNALSRYTSSPPAGGAVSLRLGQARFSVSPGDRFIAAPLLRSPQRGRQSRDRAARLANKHILPEHRNFLRCAQHLCCLSHPACPFPRGSRGAEPHCAPAFDFNSVRRSKSGLTSRRRPRSGLSFSLFFFLRERKRGYRRRCRKTSVAKAKSDSHQIKKSLIILPHPLRKINTVFL